MKAHRAKARNAAALLLALAAWASPVSARDAAAGEPARDAAGRAPENAIVVTGSIVRGGAPATVPLVTLSAADLANRGILTVADAVQQLPANNAGSNPTSWAAFGFTPGASAVSLRGFNDAYSLVLVNGLRTAAYPLADDGYRNFVDLNALPLAVLDRIDVLQADASATYGSDAIAGVVNAVLKREVQGLHLAGSGGISGRGDAGERRLSATFGLGNLHRDGWNVYANVEWQHDDPLMFNQRGAPFNTSDLSSICNAAGACMANGVLNGVQANGSFTFAPTTVPYVRPYNAATLVAVPGQRYQLLDPARGCQGLAPYSLTAAQQAVPTAATTPATVCQQDPAAQFFQYAPDLTRKGATLKATVDVGSHAQAWVLANFSRVDSSVGSVPLGFAGRTAPGGAQVTLTTILLPVWVCPNGSGNADPRLTGCNAGNGRLNPNNPYAANGQLARLIGVYDRPVRINSRADSWRMAGGIAGTLGPWGYSLEGASSQVGLDLERLNYIRLQGVLDAIAQGTFNFANPAANSEAARAQVAPPSRIHAVSKLSQVQLVVNRDVMALPGGALNVAGGVGWRFEALHDPSANPPDNANPTSRYYAINQSGADGSRRVWTLSWEVNAPILPELRVKAAGSWDHYSTGQAHVSPRFEAEFRPIPQFAVRGSFAKGFRVPSFSEAFSLATTAFQSSTINCAAYPTFCAAHASNPAYLANHYQYALTSLGNPGLAPETSTSFTGGIELKPIPQLTISADFWSATIDNVIVPVTAGSAVFDQYYLNNGAVNLPGIAVTAAGADPLNPNALPLLGNVEASYRNADSFRGKGVDVAVRTHMPLGRGGLAWESRLDASWLLGLSQTDAGVTLAYEGTLGPCRITACSGAPKLRLVWTNRLDFGGRASVALTANYTSGTSEIAPDAGGIPGDCAGSIGHMVAKYSDNTPVLCEAGGIFDLDGHASVRVADRFTLSLDVLDLLDKAPPFDPGTGNGFFNFNPAWAGKLFVGRFIRVGAQVDF